MGLVLLVIAAIPLMINLLAGLDVSSVLKEYRSDGTAVYFSCVVQTQ
ncbi:MAG: hypothetical protein R2912_10280 [Eubacteriales bacterium]